MALVQANQNEARVTAFESEKMKLKDSQLETANLVLPNKSNA